MASQGDEHTQIGSFLTGPYDANYEQALNDRGAFFALAFASQDAKPKNYDYIMQRLEATRSPDLTTELSNQHFDFIMKSDTGSQETLFDSVIPTIQGTSDGLYARNRKFSNMRFDENISTTAPDYYEGVHPKDIHSEVKKSLSKMIIPTKSRGTKDPAAPNYFLEVKAPTANGEVARLQAGIAGVLGARGLHSLQNHCTGRKGPVYDGNAYTFSVTYFRYELTIYATYLTAPSEHDDQPHYTVTEIGYYSMKNKNHFLEGITACRNIRELAKEFREEFVNEANKRVMSARQTQHASGSRNNLSKDGNHSGEVTTDPDVGPWSRGLGDEDGEGGTQNLSTFESWTSFVRGCWRR